MIHNSFSTSYRGLPLLLIACIALIPESSRSFAPALSFPRLRYTENILAASTRSGEREIGGNGSSTSSTVASNTSGERELAEKLKVELMQIANRTNRGFKANKEDRKKARQIILDLAQLSPTKEPARSFYKDQDQSSNDAIERLPSLTGKWTLVYTDAPDITSLDQNPLAELGRIGQECSPPFIKNVIEWKRPAWAANFPLSGSSDSRVFQKVVTQASATPDRPNRVNLELAGLQVESDKEENQSSTLSDSIQKNGLIAGLIKKQSIDLNGPINTPFGEFEILYLDDELRAIKTGQNYLAVNLRQAKDSEWF